MPGQEAIETLETANALLVETFPSGTFTRKGLAIICKVGPYTIRVAVSEKSPGEARLTLEAPVELAGVTGNRVLNLYAAPAALDVAGWLSWAHTFIVKKALIHLVPFLDPSDFLPANRLGTVLTHVWALNAVDEIFIPEIVRKLNWPWVSGAQADRHLVQLRRGSERGTVVCRCDILTAQTADYGYHLLMSSGGFLAGQVLLRHKVKDAPIPPGQDPRDTATTAFLEELFSRALSPWSRLQPLRGPLDEGMPDDSGPDEPRE